MVGRVRSIRRASSWLRLGLVGLVCLVLCLASWLTVIAAGPSGGWTPLKSLPTAVAEAAAVALPDGRVVVIGGYDATGKATKVIQVYDPDQNEWSTSTAHLSTARTIPASALGQDGKVYVFGGSTGSSSLVSSVEAYEASTDSVSQLSNAGCIGRAGLAAVALLDGRIMLMGGRDDTGKATTKVEFFDTGTGKCTLATGAGLMPTARMYFEAVRGADGLIYAIGGFNNSDGSLAAVDVFDPSSGSWSEGMPLPEPRLHAAAVTEPDGKIYVIGGENLTTSPRTYYSNVLRYDPDSKSWETLPSSFNLPEGRTQLAAVAISDKIVAIGGFSGAEGKTNLKADVYGLGFEVAPPDTTAPVTSIAPDRSPNSEGWFTGAVTVTLSASDDDSGVKEIDYTLDGGMPQVYSGAFTVDGDGSHPISFWSVDNAGNPETAHDQTIKIDSTPPAITARVQDGGGNDVDPKPGTWYTGPLTITFSCSDVTSGIDTSDPTACQGTSQLEDGRNQSISGTARDRAGNTSSYLIEGINVGDPSPLVDYVLQNDSGTEIPPNSAGWFNQPVKVHFLCSPVSGALTKCGPDVTLGEGASQTVTGTAVDDQGHSRTVTTDSINIDLTKPEFTFELRGDDGKVIEANAAGWFNQAVTLHVDCNDLLSGIVDCPEDATYHDTTASRFDLTIHDRAGNATNILVENINIDTSRPQVSCPTADADWHADDVVFICQASDDRSNIGAEDASFTLTTSVPDGSETDQAVTNSRTVCDLAGNCADPVQISGVRVDKLAPLVRIDSPAGSYPQGAEVKASFQCSDGGSGIAGIAGCSGTAANDEAVDTSTPGDHSFSVTATDGVGHQTVQTITYTVLEAPDDPGDDDPPLGSNDSRYQVRPLSGSTLTVTRGYWALIRIELWDTELDAPAAPRLKLTAIDVSPAAATFKAPGNLNARFQYSREIGEHGGYQLALNTRNLAPGDYLLRFIVDGDEAIQQVAFTVR